MSQRREIEHHRHKLVEIREIMDSMKTLAYMETHKLFRFLDAQKRLIDSIDDMADDFLCFHPDILPSVEPTLVVHLLIGSQRGFCGDFNEILVKQLKSELHETAQHDCKLIAVGQKLHPLLENMRCDTVNIEGANVSEEISSVVTSIANSLSSNQRKMMALQVLHHTEDGNINSESILPPFTETRIHSTKFNHSPQMNMSPRSFLLELTEQHLFINLHRLLFTSLMAENQSRIHHLDNAINHLDNKTSELTRKSNAMRQEEIIEEIEVILLNASS